MLSLYLKGGCLSQRFLSHAIVRRLSFLQVRFLVVIYYFFSLLDEALKVSHERFILLLLRMFLVIIFVGWYLIEFEKLTFTLATFCFSLRLFLTIESTALRGMQSPIFVLQSLKSFLNSSMSLVNRYLVKIRCTLRPKWCLISSIIVDFILNLLSC